MAFPALHPTGRPEGPVQRPTPGSRVAWSRLIQMILGRFPDKAKYFACFEPKLKKMVKDKVTELEPRCCVFFQLNIFHQASDAL